MQICIFGASGDEIDPRYIEETYALGQALAKNGHSMIFGGGAHGLMGAAARGVYSERGKIVGVAPRFFDIPGVLFEHCDDFVWNDSMRDRKKYMEDNADAFIVVPGGIGTYEEFFEVLTLKQLARHAKPIVLFNVLGFFDPLIRLIADGTSSGFIRAQTESLFSVAATPEEALRFAEEGEMDVNTIRFYDAQN